MILIPLGILSLAGFAAAAQGRRAKQAADPQTIAQRQVVYETAINEVKDPAKLRTLAAAFKAEGLTAEADMLCKRAALQELPDDVKAERKAAFHKGMECTDPAKVIALSDAFDSQGCSGAAASLRKYAAGLSAAEEKTDEQA